MSERGFGASPLGGIHGAFAEQDSIDAVHAALDSGVTFIYAVIYAILTPVRGQGWINGQPENHAPGRRL